MASKGGGEGANLQPGARGRHVHSALGAVGWRGRVCVLASVEAELGQFVACGALSDAVPPTIQGLISTLTVRSFELEGFAVLARNGVSGRVEGHASSENERLMPKSSEDDFN